MAVLELTSVERALDRVAEGRTPDAAEATSLLDTPVDRLPALLEAASALRDRGRGRRITFSAKVFIPLTTLCRDYCGYCTFRKDPGEPGAFTMTPDQVLALAHAGARLGAKEALFSLGDKPEALFPEHRAVLRSLGHRTTLGYLREISARVLDETGLLPHANPGLMTERDLASLREVNVSMGIMLESTSERLLARGAAHDRAPDKVPHRRLKTIARAGTLGIPFTTGILIGSARPTQSGWTRSSPSAICTSATGISRRSSFRTSAPRRPSRCAAGPSPARWISSGPSRWPGSCWVRP